MSPAHAVPNWRVVVDAVLDRIRAGDYPVSRPQPGQRFDERAKLPSTDALVDEFGFSRTVIQQAIRHLQDVERVVAGAPGKGVYVISLPQSEPGETPEELAQRIRAMEEFLREHLGYTPPGDDPEGE